MRWARLILPLVAFAAAACGPDGPGESGDPVGVVIETSMGTIKAELYPEKAPITVKNFLAYVDDKHYDGTIFHRVIADFMIQGGGMEPDMREKRTKPPIKIESRNGLKNERGTLAMARTGDPDSATSQFFINTVDNTRNLGPGGVSPDGYAVFGKVTEGMEVVDKIRKVRTIKPGDVPAEPVVIQSIRRESK